MNEIKKLHQVIETLEEQSSQVHEISGVLGVINAARKDIDHAVTSIKSLLKDHQTLVDISDKKLEDYVERLDELKSLLIRDHQNLVSRNDKNFERHGEQLDELKSQIKDLDNRLNKVINEIAVLDFVTPEQYDLGHAALEAKFAEHHSKLTEEMNAAFVSQESFIKSLRTLFVLGLIVLAFLTVV